MTEEQFHISVVDYLQFAARKDVLWWHCPNGGKRSKAAAGKLKAMGVKPGIPDLQFLFPDGTTAFIELKRQGVKGKVKAGRQSEDQIAFETFCAKAGVAYAVAYNFDQAKAVLVALGVVRSRA